MTRVIDRHRLGQLTWSNGPRRERAFAATMAARGITVQPNVRLFKFGLSSYRPDFYEPVEDVYYEVIGSRQRYAQLRPRLDLMRHVEPAIHLRVVTPEGDPYLRRVSWRRDRLAEELDAALATHGMTASELAQLAGISYPTLSHAMKIGDAKSRAISALRRRLAEWADTGAMPPPAPTWDDRTASRRAERRALADRLVARIREGGLLHAAIARGLGVVPQVVNDALHAARSRRRLHEIAAWLDGPGANGAGRVDLRRRAVTYDAAVLRQRVADSGLTQTEIARRLECSQSSVSRLLRDHGRSSLARRLEALLVGLPPAGTP